MATFKHISSKNADYGAAEQYLTFEHDEFTMKPTLDEAGRLILREDYRIATLNCGEEDFAVACMRANLRYGKNQKREDVKSHHYIISFDPRDAADNGLTVDRAQALGEEFCAEHFPGHQAILAMLRYEWIWYKERGTGFLNANRAPLKKSENILVFYQKSPVYNPQFTYGKPYTRVHSRGGTSSNYGKFERQGSESNDGRRYPGNVLFVPTVSGGIHPTQKPVELCEYLIRTYTRPGELVADICAGSGTTAIAAINTERRFVCFETAPAFYAAASERIRAAQAVKSSGEKGV